jgi:hypothetical protein
VTKRSALHQPVAISPAHNILTVYAFPRIRTLNFEPNSNRMGQSPQVSRQYLPPILFSKKNCAKWYASQLENVQLALLKYIRVLDSVEVKEMKPRVIASRKKGNFVAFSSVWYGCSRLDGFGKI